MCDVIKTVLEGNLQHWMIFFNKDLKCNGLSFYIKKEENYSRWDLDVLKKNKYFFKVVETNAIENIRSVEKDNKAQIWWSFFF